jgi:hypothetical protein
VADEKRLPIGPWEYFPAHNYEGFAIAPKGRLPTLAAVERKGLITVFNYPDATEAHARLIAAAPELLATLRTFLSLHGSTDAVSVAARAVIAKAEGRS